MITVMQHTSEPLAVMGEVASFCWNSIPSKKIAINCLEANHGRVTEFVDVILKLEGYSARMIRELYTASVGISKLQESTRYVDYKDFDYYRPASVMKDDKARAYYEEIMENISGTYQTLLDDCKIPKEDIANILPLGMMTKCAIKINLRAILHLFEIRTCSRTYKEFRDFMEHLRGALIDLDEDWEYIITNYAKTQCEKVGHCTEAKSCGRYAKK